MFYMIGRDKSKRVWRVLKIDRTEPSELNIFEDPTIYTEIECQDLLVRLREGNKFNGGLESVTKCYGIVGFIKFLGPYYMLLITGRTKIGVICGHKVYAVSKSEMIALPKSTVWSILDYSKDENRYKRLLSTVDLTRDFFFSYSYHVMHSLQRNLCDGEMGQVSYKKMFVWNEFLTREIRNYLESTIWTVALSYGYFKQAQLAISGKQFSLTLIARRSRLFAGTRYLKRGVNEKGRVANDVETEQIVLEDIPGAIPTQISSVVQNRGSIPLLWSQESSWLNFKPDILLHSVQDYEATRLYFKNLIKRYGNPIIILNLIKQREKKPRESILYAEFANAIEHINKRLPEDSQLRFLHWDLHKHSRRKANVLELLGKVAEDSLSLTGLFYCQVPTTLRLQTALSWHIPRENTNQNSNDNDALVCPEDILDDTALSFSESSQNESESTGDCLSEQPMFQKGVLRTNCIDCLDRTNIAQYAYGLAALGRQLHALGFIDDPKIDLRTPMAAELMHFYENMGDTLALQYGGSTAHNKAFSEVRGQWKPASQYQEFLVAFKRFYNNAYMDAEKQDAINVFLGHFQPQQRMPALWELDSDQQYKIGRRSNSFIDENARSFIKRSLSAGDLENLCESSNPVSSCNIDEKNF